MKNINTWDAVNQGIGAFIAGGPLLAVLLVFWILRGILEGIRQAARWVQAGADQIAVLLPSWQTRAEEAAGRFSSLACRWSCCLAGTIAEQIISAWSFRAEVIADGRTQA